MILEILRRWALGLVLAVTTAATGRAAEVTVFAASSLTDALREFAAIHEKGSGDRVIFNFAGSRVLARQIEEGAPADVFFSADEARMDRLAAKGLIVRETRTNLLSNELVVVVPVDGRLRIAGSPDRRIADP